MAWGKNGTPDTVSGSATTTIRVSDMTATTFVQTMAHAISTATALVEEGRIDNLSTSTYASRHNINGGSDGTLTTQDAWTIHYYGTNSGTYFTVGYMINISASEKLRIHTRIEQGTAGAGNAPHRVEFVGKQSGTSSQLTDYQQLDDGAGSYVDVDSNLSCLGTD